MKLSLRSFYLTRRLAPMLAALLLASGSAVPAAQAESLMVELIDSILDRATGHSVRGSQTPAMEPPAEVIYTSRAPAVVHETIVEPAPASPSVRYSEPAPPPPPTVTYSYVETPPPTVVYAAPPAPVVVLGAALTGLAFGSLFWAAGHHHHHGYYRGGGYAHRPYRSHGGYYRYAPRPHRWR